MRVRRSIRASASVLALATISSASWLRALDHRLAVLVGRLRPWPHIRPSAPRLPCAAFPLRRAGRGSARSCRRAPCRSRAGTFFQMMIAMTTIIASEMNAGAEAERRRLRRSCGGSLRSPVVVTVLSHGVPPSPPLRRPSQSTLMPVRRGDHVLRRLGRHRLDLGAGRCRPRRGSSLRRFDLRVDLLGRRLHLRLGIEGACLLGLLGELARLRARAASIRARHAASVASASRARLLRASRSSAIFFSRSRPSPGSSAPCPAPMTKKMMPNTTTSQNSCDAEDERKLIDLRHSSVLPAATAVAST